MSNPSIQSSSVNTLQARSVVGGSLNASSILHVSGPIVGHPTVSALTATGAVPASALPNGFLVATPTANPSTYTLPTPAQIVAAFAAAGNALVVGNVFEVKVQNASGANGALFAIGAGMISGTALETIPARGSAILIFRVISSTSITVYQMVSA